MSGIVMALTDSVVASGGRQPIVIRKGEAWRSDDPVVLANPGLFTKDADKARGTVPREVVEQSTRAPGEKSSARRRG